MYKRFFLASIYLVSAMLITSCTASDRTARNLDAELAALLYDAQVGALEMDIKPSPEKIALGEMLFWDPELSGNRDTACVTCHHPLFGTGDGLSLPVGTGGRGVGSDRQLGVDREFVARNATPIYNLGFSEWETMFWDGRVAGALIEGYENPASDDLLPDLENAVAVQALFPVTSRDEMLGDRGDVDIFGQPNELSWIRDFYPEQVWSGLMLRLMAIPEYVQLFHAAYPETNLNALGFQHAANAIAAYEIATFTLLDSPWDRYLSGDLAALSKDEKRGALLFYGKAACVDCHAGDLMTDQDFHNLAIPHIGPGKGREAPLDYGRANETGDDCDLFAFRTPPLRNAAITGPWMHNGSYINLRDAVVHMLNPLAALQDYQPDQLDPELQGPAMADQNTIDAAFACPDIYTGAVALTEQELDDMIAFLNALTSISALDGASFIPERVPSGLPVGGY
ncbi:MAG: cytochrome c peroxidase [Chloroflexota bacterium]